MRSFMKLEPSRNSINTLSFTEVGKSCNSREFLVWQICHLTQFAKITLAKISRVYGTQLANGLASTEALLCISNDSVLIDLIIIIHPTRQLLVKKTQEINRRDH